MDRPSVPEPFRLRRHGESHLITAARYVSMNPVRARLAPRAQDWPWSSAKAHLAGRDDALVTVGPLRDRIGDFAAFLAEGEDRTADRVLRAAETTGRPLGDRAFIETLERRLGRTLARAKPGPKPKPRDGGNQPGLGG